MVSPLHTLLDAVDLVIRYKIILIICQALLYGIYLCLFPIAVHAMITNGLHSRARKWILATITFLFALINVYWICSVVSTLVNVDLLNNILTACHDSQSAFACLKRELVSDFNQSAWNTFMSFDDMLFINFIIGDGVVVWRAWVLCSDQSKIVLMIPVVMLAINTSALSSVFLALFNFIHHLHGLSLLRTLLVIYLSMVVLTAISVITNDVQFSFHITDISNITEVALMTLSLIINIYATSIIAFKAWKYRKLLMENGIGNPTSGQAIKILALLVESGVVYILIGVMTSTSIALFKGKIFATLIFLVGVHLAGIYPIVIVLLVEKNRSLNTTYCSFGTSTKFRADRPSQATFASGPVLASGGQIALGTKPPDQDTRLGRQAGPY